jgi:phage gp36-like protein
MPYLTIAQLESRKDRRSVWELANDANLDVDALEDDDDELASATANVEAAIDDASDFIDDRLADRFEVPLDDPDGAILRICSDLAIYYLAMRRRTEEPMDLAETRKKCESALDAWGRAGAGTQPPFAGRDETKPFRS